MAKDLSSFSSSSLRIYCLYSPIRDITEIIFTFVRFRLLRVEPEDAVAEWRFRRLISRSPQEEEPRLGMKQLGALLLRVISFC
jgi:hypothetical protein